VPVVKFGSPVRERDKQPQGGQSGHRPGYEHGAVHHRI
jgi:hypothetical protein